MVPNKIFDKKHHSVWVFPASTGLFYKSLAFLLWARQHLGDLQAVLRDLVRRVLLLGDLEDILEVHAVVHDLVLEQQDPFARVLP